MKAFRSICLTLISTSLLLGQAVPTNQIIHPTADVLPGMTLNVQAGFSDLVALQGWHPAVSAGLGGFAEFEWKRNYFYSDLEYGAGSIPTAGIKVNVPISAENLHLAVAFYNAQKWNRTQSQTAVLAASDVYSGSDISSVRFESIYSRIDFLADVQYNGNLRLHLAAYFLESKSRNLNVSYYDGVIPVSSSDGAIIHDAMVGGGVGFSYRVDADFTYLAQWLAAPQYQLDPAARKLELAQRHLLAAGIRYRLADVLVLDTGIYHDALTPRISNIQIYAQVNLILDAAIFKFQQP